MSNRNNPRRGDTTKNHDKREHNLRHVAKARAGWKRITNRQLRRNGVTNIHRISDRKELPKKEEE